MNDFANDPHWGKGGRYEVVDGQRVPVGRAQPAPETAAPPVPAPATERSAPATQPAKKGN